MSVANAINQGFEQGKESPRGSPSPLPAWLYAIVLVDALLLATGAVIALVHPAMLVSPHDAINGAVRIYAGYLVSRNLTIAVFLLLALALRARGMLNSLMLLTAFVQLTDAGIDCLEGRWMVAPGVMFLGLVFLFAAGRMKGYPFWRIEAWRD